MQTKRRAAGCADTICAAEYSSLRDGERMCNCAY